MGGEVTHNGVDVVRLLRQFRAAIWRTQLVAIPHVEVVYPVVGTIPARLRAATVEIALGAQVARLRACVIEPDVVYEDRIASPHRVDASSNHVLAVESVYLCLSRAGGIDPFPTRENLP